MQVSPAVYSSGVTASRNLESIVELAGDKGALSGILPARKASQQKPVEALKYE